MIADNTLVAPRLRWGLTTGTYAAAAAIAAGMVALGIAPPPSVSVILPDGASVDIPVLAASCVNGIGSATVVKDAGDDPDVTHGCEVVVSVEWRDEPDICFKAGEGVGTVTKPGLSEPPGEPAINPTPRLMIEEALRAISSRGACVTVSIPGGAALAAQTFNPKLGIVGGLSILGTTGRVRPFSADSLRCALLCGLNVAIAANPLSLVYVPGNMGRNAALNHLRVCPEQVVEVSNEWGYMLDAIRERTITHLLVMGHPGKLAKLPGNHWNTHSSQSPAALPYVRERAEGLGLSESSQSETVEGFIMAFEPAARARLAAVLACSVREAVAERLGPRIDLACCLINNAGDILGCSGDMSPWT